MVLDPAKMGLKVGLEIHQQLAIKGKLFCDCQRKSEDFHARFQRSLRPSQSELGEIDPAATFEFRKGLVNRYAAGKDTSCLVEADEEPPHDLNMEAVEAGIIVARALNASVVDEIHVMRKIVIDGSNTSGFQRTAVIALGGALMVNEKEIPVQTITLEEDAARIMGDEEGYRDFALDRLGIPLIEVSLAPITATPEEVRDVALALGRLMRSTGKVARGLGTIRQDLNVSVAGGEVIEVKGVQRLEDLSSIVRYEMERQTALTKVAEELRVKRRLSPESLEVRKADLTEQFRGTVCSVIKRVLSSGGVVIGLGVRGFGGFFGLEPIPDIRLGKEISEMVRFYGLGGIFHSDELPAYGITLDEGRAIKGALSLAEGDGFVILAGRRSEVEEATKAVSLRCRHAIVGVPAETRGPTHDGKTRYIRPRPGAARMYPETDIPIVPVTKELLERVASVSWKGWDEEVRALEKEYGLSHQLALNIFDSDYLDLFRRAVAQSKVPPSFVASVLAETMTSMSRAGFDLSILSDETILDLFILVDMGEMAKEGVQPVLEALLRGKARIPKEAAEALGLKSLSDKEIEEVIRSILEENRKVVVDKGERAIGSLMGVVMAQLRGRADGKRVSSILKERIQDMLASS